MHWCNKLLMTHSDVYIAQYKCKTLATTDLVYIPVLCIHSLLCSSLMGESTIAGITGGLLIPPKQIPHW